MKLPRLAAGPDWKQFLGLGEQLLKQPNAAAQCQSISETLESILGCQAHTWLVEPFSPLPGEPEITTLPDAPAPDLVHRVLESRQAGCLADGNSIHTPCSSEKNSREAAFPIFAQENLIGIVHIERKKGPAFRPEEWNFLEALTAHAGTAMLSTRQAALINWRYEQLNLVRSVMAQVANVHNIDELCQKVSTLILESFHFYHVSIFTLEPGRQDLLMRTNVTKNLENEPPLDYSVVMGQGLIGSAALTGEEQVAQDVREHPQYRYFEKLDKTRSEAALPLKVDQQILGVLDVESDRREAFQENDILVLRSLADGIALAIEGARHYNAQKRRADQISAIVEVTHVLTSILDLDRLLEEVVQVIQKRFNYQHVHLFSVHHGRRTVFYLTGSGWRSEKMRLLDYTYDLDASVGIIPFAARTGHTYLANDVSKDTMYVRSDLPPDDTRSELAIPLKFGDEVLGVLDLQNDQVEAFSNDDVSLLEALSASIAIAYHNATLYRSEQWRRQVGDSFKDVAGLLSTNVALEQLLDTILTELERSLPCDAAAVWLVENPSPLNRVKGHPVKLAAVHGVSQEVINTAKEDSEQMQDWLNELLNLEGPTTRNMNAPSGPLGAALGFPDDYSLIAAPLRTGDELLGLVILTHHTANRYGTEARSILSTFASYAAVAIQNARLYSEAQTQAWLSTILLQVAEVSQSVNSVDELLSSMVRLTRLLVGLKKCAVFLWDEVQEAFIMKDSYGIEQPHRTIFDPSEVPAITQMRLSRSMVYIQDAASELNLPAAALPQGNGSLILMPLLTRDSLQGAFLVAHQSNNNLGVQSTIDQQTVSILQGIAHQTSVALENLHLLEARQEEAYVTAVLLQVAQAVVSQNELQDILDTIVHLMPILVGIDASIVCLWDPVQKTFHTAQVYAGSRELESDLSTCAYKPGQFHLLEQVRLSDAAYYCKVPENTPAPGGWYDLEPLPIDFMKTDVLLPGEDWLLGFPLSVKGELLGVLLAKETAASTIFHERRLEIVTGIAQQAALAIQNERLTQRMVVRERLEREIQLARQIQQTFLPSRMPRWEGWEIAARWEPAREVGGDFYDIFRLSRGRLGMAIADVSDKGLAAALYMTVARTLIRAYAQNARSAATVLQRANHPLVADTPHSMYVTAVFSILDPESGELEYANAGHNRPLLLRVKDQTIEELPKGGMAMGVMAKHQLSVHHLTVDPGDCLLFYTDGVTEMFSAQGEAYGEERLRNTLQGCIGMNAEEVLKKIETDLAEFQDNAPASDDMTLLAIRRLEWHK